MLLFFHFIDSQNLLERKENGQSVEMKEKLRKRTSVFQLRLVTPWVNFTNIYARHFCMKVLRQSFSVLEVNVKLFIDPGSAKKICVKLLYEKGGHKMVVKLTH